MARCAKHGDLVFFCEGPGVKKKTEISISPWSKYVYFFFIQRWAPGLLGWVCFGLLHGGYVSWLVNLPR